MVKTLAELKKMKKGSSAQFVNKIEQKLTRKKGPSDPRFWAPTFGSDGTAKATIRLLPAKDEDADPIVCVRRHFFEHNGQKYAETSRLTLGDNEADPAQEYGWRLWHQNTKASKDKARQVLAKDRFICNIYVVKDPGAPENEGKVFLYEMPKTVAEQVKKSGAETEEDGEVIPGKEVIGLFEAHNFIMDLYKKDKFPAYDRCKFSERATDLLKDGTVDEYQKILDSLYSLNEFVDPDKIKSYSALKKRLTEVIGDEAGDDDTGKDDTSSSSDAGETGSSADEGSGDGESEGEDESYYERIANRRNKKA